MTVSFIIPVYNGSRTIAEVVRRVNALNLKKQIIIVDDGSTDATPKVLETLKNQVDVIHSSVSNGGKGTAIRIGIGYVKGDVVIIQDADLELNPEECPLLIESIQAGKTEVVYGSRFLRPPVGVPWKTRAANRFLTRLTNLMYGSRLTDMETGFKVFRSSVVKNLPLKSRRFEFEPEVTARLLQAKVGILEVPVSYVPRSAREGKTIGWKDGLHAIWTLLRCRLFPE